MVGSPPDSSFSQISKFRAFYSRSWRRMRKVRAGHHTPGTRQFITGRLDISTYARGMSFVDAILSSKFHAGVSRTFDWSNRWDTILPTDTDLNSPRA